MENVTDSCFAVRIPYKSNMFSIFLRMESFILSEIFWQTNNDFPFCYFQQNLHMILAKAVGKPVHSMAVCVPRPWMEI